MRLSEMIWKDQIYVIIFLVKSASLFQYLIAFLLSEIS